jgi:multicomponent Na+:H+ antiporter subunit C
LRRIDLELLLAIVVGFLYAAGLYMIMRRSIVKLIIGLALLGHAVNLLIFLMGSLTKGKPPLVPPGAEMVEGAVADPVPQALILTSIVIGFAIQAFAVVLIRKVHHVVKTDDLDALQSTEQQP